ncbi:MAG: DinB family protein [Pirellulales bacterium]
MSETSRIAKQLEKTFTGPAWHGPAVEQILDGVTAEVAARPSPAAIHSIWQIVDHMTFWEAAVRGWLAGDRTRPADEASWPTISDTSEGAWQATRQRLRETHQALVVDVAQLDDARLTERIFDDMPSLYAILHGVVQHNIYHAGQIALLKKIAAR